MHGFACWTTVSLEPRLQYCCVVVSVYRIDFDAYSQAARGWLAAAAEACGPGIVGSGQRRGGPLRLGHVPEPGDA